MRKILPVWVSAISIVVAIYFASLLTFQTSAQQKNSAQKWEYCAITRFYATESYSKALGFAQISYLEQSGYRETWIKYEGETVSNINHNQAEIVYQLARERALSDAIAQLGSQGWEMIGEAHFAKLTSVPDGNGGMTSKYDKAIYFKRPKQ